MKGWMDGWMDGWMKEERGTVGRGVVGNEGCNGCME